MSIILATILAISAPDGITQETAAPPVRAAAPAAQLSGRELSEAAHAAMRRWAKATDQEAETAARELLDIYTAIQQDTRMARSQRETLRLTVRARLDQLCTQIGKQIAKDKSVGKSVSPIKSDSVKSVAADKSTQTSAALAQMGVPAGGGAGRGAAAGQNANADAGQQLVDLIQNTISPKSWDVNGGAGTIYYWQQQHAIVVRATGDIHGEISDALEQLNRASH
jgi:hypothetical protein